ncbi:MAG: polysaccharide deacetylase family protein [Betaproteobacteria bacterium]|nr:polysaccharide deacetylase family protein [Betaproteobacteria bacterium]
MFRALFSVLSPSGARARLSIFIFHRVLAERDPLFPGEVTRAEFDAICGWLRGWCNVLPLGVAAKALKDGTLPSRAVAITFDDGYADNHDQAAPVLARHGLTATFFIASGFLDGGRMWNDTVIESVRRCGKASLDLRQATAAALDVLALGTNEGRRQAIDRILAATKYRPPAERARWVDAIAEAAEVTLPNDLMMTSAQVRSLHRSGMEIGAHTVSHPILRDLPIPAAEKEIRDGRQALQEIIAAPVRLFAYPNGKPSVDYSSQSVDLVRELGFDAAVSTERRAANATDDFLQLPRYTPWERTEMRFGLRMAHTLATT